MKKKILFFAAVLICLSIIGYGTLAYFTSEDTATNVITAGNIRIELLEWSENADGQRVPFADVMDVMPGHRVSKIVEVENTGNHAAWVRVAVEKAIVLAEGKEGEIDLRLVELDVNTQYWTELDGYYYYNTAVEAGQVTQPLFTCVTFSDEMGNLYQQSTCTVTVQAQAVQVANNGESVFEAAGWPEAE